jgi:serine/threonine protein kinase
MPSPTTNDEFLDLVRKSGVVEEKRLTAELERLRAAGPLPAEPGRLAGLFVRDGLLTQFQAEQFLQGKWRRFTIGKYKVLERLGAGGMGSVYLCEHKLMRRRVAVKVLPTAKAEDAAALERFYREARAVAALDHPNIVRAYDIDQDDKLHFLVMEHVDGASLQEIIKKTGPMDVLRACHYIRQAALGLQHAHEAAGLVHRDIKPGNILVDRNGIVKVLDMGLARFFHDEEDVLTKKYDENVLGTADYLAPEQAIDSHGVDIRADIYSLGATFYYCLTGRTPFAEGTVAQKLIWHQTRQPKPLRVLRPEVPEGVGAIVEKMMSKDPAQRFPTPRDVADVLAPWTQTPIPPPPDNEMPTLSPAALGSSTEASMAGPRTPSGGLPSPGPRKNWQVSGGPVTPASAPPAPRSGPPPVPPPPQARKGSTPLPTPAPAPVPTPTPAPPAPGAPAVAPTGTRAAPPTPARTVTPAPAPAPPKPTVNGTVSHSAVAPAPAPAPVSVPADRVTPVPAGPEELPSWEKIAADAAGTEDSVEKAPRSGRRAGSRRRPEANRGQRKLWWVVGGVALFVLSGVAAVVAWAFFAPAPEKKTETGPTRPTYVVNRSGQNGALTSISAALARARLKPTLGARIIVQHDIAEEVAVGRLSHVTIEAEGDQPLSWKRPRGVKDDPDAKLLLIGDAEDFQLKGFAFDGDNHVKALISLTGKCPGCVLEKLTLKGFLKRGIWVTNCEGNAAPGMGVLLQDLTFDTKSPDQEGVFFGHEENLLSTSANAHITIRKYRVEGPGKAARTNAPNKLEDVHLEDPPGKIESGQP